MPKLTLEVVAISVIGTIILVEGIILGWMLLDYIVRTWL
jgi:hypothetical protein